ncbi:hypothetical protein C8Q76DRAFT_703523 [Earliella scabrosa]|nr:hypothetical protein C8Q76DRAFT_703523 [Earliella scabrosa]
MTNSRETHPDEEGNTRFICIGEAEFEARLAQVARSGEVQPCKNCTECRGITGPQRRKGKERDSKAKGKAAPTSGSGTSSESNLPAPSGSLDCKAFRNRCQRVLLRRHARIELPCYQDAGVRSTLALLRTRYTPERLEEWLGHYGAVQRCSCGPCQRQSPSEQFASSTETQVVARYQMMRKLKQKKPTASEGRTVREKTPDGGRDGPAEVQVSARGSPAVDAMADTRPAGISHELPNWPSSSTPSVLSTGRFAGASAASVLHPRVEQLQTDHRPSQVGQKLGDLQTSTLTGTSSRVLQYHGTRSQDRRH